MTARPHAAGQTTSAWQHFVACRLDPDAGARGHGRRRLRHGGGPGDDPAALAADAGTAPGDRGGRRRRRGRQASLLGQDDVAFAQSPSVYESVEELDTGALVRVRDSFGSAVDQAMTPQARLSPDDDDPSVGATSTAPNPATFSDDLEQLDVQGLQALRAELGGAQ